MRASNLDYQLKNKTGVYSIRFDDYGYQYIGSSSKCLLKRLKTHLRELRSNSHYNSFLQRVYNQRGEASIKIEIIEFCLPEETLIREQYYIDNSTMIFNTALSTTSLMKGRKHTEETKAKMKEYHKDPEYKKRIVRTGLIHTPEAKAAMSLRRKGIPRSKAAIEKMKETIKKNGRIMSESTKEKLRNKIITDSARLNMSVAQKKYANENKERKKEIAFKKRLTIQCNENGLLFKGYEEAANYFNCSKASICDHLNGRLKSIHGKYTLFCVNKDDPSPRKSSSHYLYDGIAFPSRKDLANYLQISEIKVRQLIKLNKLPKAVKDEESEKDS